MTEESKAAEDTSEETFDQRLRRLESIVTTLEDEDLELEAAIDRYKEGVSLLKGCRDLITGYRAQVEELTGEARSSLRPMDGDPDARS